MASIQRDPIILDLSVWNRGFNSSVLKAKAHAVILRCQYGTFEDAKFREFRAKLEADDIPWTPYLFWVANVDAKKQIELFMKLTGHYENGKWVFDGKFGAWMDMEEQTRPITMTKATLLAKWIEFVKLFKSMTGLKIGVYTSPGWWNANMPDTPMTQALEVMLWVAHWGTDKPLLPKDWQRYKVLTWEMHQHSADGNQQGAHFGILSRDVDMNNYRWGISGFKKAYGLELKPLTDIQDVLVESVTVTPSALNLRNAPNGDIIGSTTMGKVFYPDGVELDTSGMPWYYIGAKKKLYLAAWLTR
jgi:GH25 family lysozyme M1 (1,4-beta-N-acetylmuramidase)